MSPQQVGQNWEKWLIRYSCAALQRDFNRLEKWAGRSLVKVSKRKRKVLHVGRNSRRHLCGLGKVPEPSDPALKLLLFWMEFGLGFPACVFL